MGNFRGGQDERKPLWAVLAKKPTCREVVLPDASTGQSRALGISQKVVMVRGEFGMRFCSPGTGYGPESIKNRDKLITPAIRVNLRPFFYQ